MTGDSRVVQSWYVFPRPGVKMLLTSIRCDPEDTVLELPVVVLASCHPLLGTW